MNDRLDRVAALIGEGRTNREIAEQLGLTQGQVSRARLVLRREGRVATLPNPIFVRPPPRPKAKPAPRPVIAASEPPPARTAPLTLTAEGRIVRAFAASAATAEEQAQVVETAMERKRARLVEALRRGGNVMAIATSHGVPAHEAFRVAGELRRERRA